MVRELESSIVRQLEPSTTPEELLRRVQYAFDFNPNYLSYPEASRIASRIIRESGWAFVPHKWDWARGRQYTAIVQSATGIFALKAVMRDISEVNLNAK